MTANKPMTLRAVKTAISTALMAIAREQASAGDQTLLRALTSGGSRYVVEAMSIEPDPLNKCSAAASGRRRKFSNPLFLTPYGRLEGFPQSDDALFLDADAAHQAIAKHGQGVRWQVSTTTLQAIQCSKAFVRWKAEVSALPQGQEYAEPRRTLEDSFAIYQREGMEGLRKHYTRTHAWHLIKKFKDNGLL